jgi:hypothetical protein
MRVLLLLTRLLRTLEPLGAGARPVHPIRVGGTFLAICENVRVGRVLTGIYFTWKLPLRGRPQAADKLSREARSDQLL